MKHNPTQKHRLATAIALTLGLGLSQAWAENAIQGMNVTTEADGSMHIRFSMSEAPKAVPANFSIEQPARIALDFQDTTVQMDKRLQTIESGPVHDVRFAEAQGRTRAVISLKQNSAYDVRVSGQEVILSIQPQGVAPAAQAGTSNDAPAPQQAAQGEAQIDFRRGAQGEGRLLVSLPAPNVPMTMNAEAKRLIIDLPQTRLTEQKYDVGDFGTPARQVTVQRRGAGSRLIIETSDPFEKLAYQADNQLTVEIRPLPKAEATALLGPKEYKGERLTLKFQDIEIRPLLQLLADFTGNNIVVSDSVQGRMSLRLENVPWDQAMDLILSTKGLSQRKNGNVIFIAPTAEIAAREKVELEAQRQTQELAPLVSEFMQVNYAKASDIALLLRPVGAAATAATPGAIVRPTGFLSPRGTITVDDRTNTLLINDTPDSLEKIRDLVKKLDTQIKQVLIETRIVIATDNFAKELGVRWGVTGVSRNGSDAAVITGSGAGSDSMINNIGAGLAPGLPLQGDRYNINLPMTDPTRAGGLALAVLGSNVLIDLELKALQTEGKGEIVSSPRVLTANGQKASIKQGQKIPYSEASSSGATTTKFIDAVLAAEVTPQITPNNNVIMDINVKKDEPDWGRVSPTGAPAINNREVNTKVQVRNGETVVLGGIYEVSSAESVDKIPFFGDLPYLGNLFKSRNST
ncbi:MAG: type IV pilus secretin PilQ, partial [Halothiobacillaceae bacterium]